MKRTALVTLPASCALVLLAALVTVAFAARAQAAPLPAWSISQQALPSSFTPGETAPKGVFAKGDYPIYFIAITNVGGESSEGTITIRDELPSGLTPAAAAKPQVWNAYRESILHFCTSAGQVVTCTVSTKVIPDGPIQMAVPVDVSLSASGEVDNQVMVEGGSAVPVSQSVSTPIGSVSPGFDLVSGSQRALGIINAEDGSPASAAGSHPYQVSLEATVKTHRISGVPAAETVTPTGNLQEVNFKLPEGLEVNPTAAPRCSEAQLVEASQNGSNHNGGCPLASQIGVFSFSSTRISGATYLQSPLYNMVPPRGVTTEFGFNAVGSTIHIEAGVDGEFHLHGESRAILAKLFTSQIDTELWGDPSSPSHDLYRKGSGGPIQCTTGPALNERGEFPCPVLQGETPFLTTPTACGPPETLKVDAESWEEPGRRVSAETPLSDGSGEALSISGCNALAFTPSISAKPTTYVADSPSGLDFNLHQPQSDSLTSLSQANLKNTRVTLPEGLVLNPSSAAGLDACSEQQMGYQPVGAKIGFEARRFEATPQSCPSGAKIGTVEATTPLLEQTVPGSIYIAKPYANPFGSLLAIYLAIEDEETGVIVKLAGKVSPDPATGQLTTTFEESPDLPVQDISLHFFNGSRGVLTTPFCGIHSTSSTLTPWSTPEGADASPSDSFAIASAPGGGCPGSEAQAPGTPRFSAGTEAPVAGAYSPFILKLDRADGTQRIDKIDATLPEGLTGRLAGVPYCSDAQIAQAESRSKPELGRDEQQSPSCPSGSELGTVSVAAGSGPNPYYVQGHAYLAGPYKGAPVSMVIVTPAVAGPFDLGTVVVRTALYVDPETAKIHAVSDRLPTILDGIPLDVRSVAVRLDKPSFTLNPTSCDAMSLGGQVGLLSGQSSDVSNRFQVGGCESLGFKPQLKIRLKGATKRIGHPALKAVLTAKPGEANIARAQVNLPHGEFLDQSNLNKTCTKPVLMAGNCPESTIYGYAKAWTPLLEKPLEGNVYLVGGYGYKLPALVAELNGQIRILLVGKVDSGKNKGIRNTFEVVPDAPVSRFVLQMKGGKKYGLLENSENLCKAKKAKRLATVSFTGQNGKVDHYKPVVSNQCGKGSKRSKKSSRHKHVAGSQVHGRGHGGHGSQ